MKRSYNIGEVNKEDDLFWVVGVLMSLRADGKISQVEKEKFIRSLNYGQKK